MFLSRSPHEPSLGGSRSRVGAIGKFLTALSTVAVLVMAQSGVSAASGAVLPTITSTNASFVIPQGAQEPPIGTTWMLKLEDLTSAKLLGTAQFTTTETQPTSTLDIAVPTVEGCNFQVDVRTTPPDQPVDTKSGSFYSDLIMVVPACGPPTTVVTTTTTTTTLPTVAPPTTSTPASVAAASVLPFTATDGTTAAAATTTA